MQPHELTPLVEAILFAADQPLTVPNLVKAVDDESVGPAEVRSVLEGLIAGYDAHPRGFKLVRLGNGYQVLTRERYAPWVRGMLAGKQKTRLSRPALETAAVIAYKQPITRLGIERVRGVDAGGVLNTLLERGLVMIKGRDPGPGRPLLYGTTQEFLEYFGLSKLGDLPRMEEIAALARTESAEEWSEVERARFERHGVEPESVPFPGQEEPDTESGEAGEEPGDSIQADRESFQEVLSDLAGRAGEPEAQGEEPEYEPGDDEDRGDRLSPGR